MSGGEQIKVIESGDKIFKTIRVVEVKKHERKPAK